MKLTREEEAMALGNRGPGLEKCMSILIKMGEVYDAEKMVPITSAHTMPKEPPQLLREVTEGVRQMPVFTSLHPMMSAFDPDKWEAMDIPREFAQNELEEYQQRTQVYERIGMYQTYTCLPMLIGNLPRQGDYISWIGSGAQIMANSLIGARTNRDGTMVNLAIALTGRAPCMGLYLNENRLGQVLVSLNDLNPGTMSDADFGAVGYYVGEIAQNRNVVIDGFPRGLTFDKLKYLMAPLSTSGSVSICHIVGLTPESPTLQAAFGGRKPSERIVVGPEQLDLTKGKFASGGTREVDMVILGCPHVTASEFKEIATLLHGQKIGDNQRLWIGMPYQAYALVKTMGYTDIVEKAGGIVTRSCMATIPDSPIPNGVSTVATNSFKAAHYIAQLTKGRVNTLVGSLANCIDASLTGRWKGTGAN